MTQDYFKKRVIPPTANIRRSKRDAALQQAVFAPNEQMAALLEVAAGIPVPPPKKKLNNHKKKGLAVEGDFNGKGVTAVLGREGYRAKREPRSEGPWDVRGDKISDATLGPTVRLVQAKRTATYSPTALNSAMHWYLGIYAYVDKPVPVASGIRREAWLWVDRQEWVAKIFLDSDGKISSEGKKGAEVEQAVRKSIAAWKPKVKRGPCLKCRALELECKHGL